MAEGGENKRKADLQLQQNKILEQLTCPICYELMAAPIYMCSNQHSMCETCKDKLAEEKCPSCSKKDLSHRNRTLENLAEVVSTECPHEGCDVCVAVAQLQEHKAKECLYAPLKCCMFYRDCTFETGCVEQFISHWESAHNRSVCSNGLSEVPRRLFSMKRLTPDLLVSNNHLDFHVLRLEHGGDAYALFARREGAAFGQGVYRVCFFQLTSPGQRGQVGKDVRVRVYGPDDEDAQMEHVLEVMNARLPPRGFPSADENIPLSAQFEVTDKQVLRFNGHKGTAGAGVFSPDRVLRFRVLFS